MERFYSVMRVVSAGERHQGINNSRRSRHRRHAISYHSAGDALIKNNTKALVLSAA